MIGNSFSNLSLEITGDVMHSHIVCTYAFQLIYGFVLGTIGYHDVTIGEVDTDGKACKNFLEWY